MAAREILPLLLGWAVLLPLISFWVILLAGRFLGKQAWYIATGAIGGAGVLAFVSLGIWLTANFPKGAHHGGSPAAGGHADAGHEKAGHSEAEHGKSGEAGHETVKAKQPPVPNAPPTSYAGEYYQLGVFGKLRMAIGYHIDALTICMFCMVTLIATCIHVYAGGYMHDELHDVEDHEVHTDHGHLHRPGRFPRFFQYLSLFCFSMLGLVLAGNILMVFVFWELVGICSYFLIGFYIERKSASTAANKAFIVNRVGDFGMIIGLMSLWAGLGTFAFGDIDYNHDGKIGADERGMFSLVRPAAPEGGHVSGTATIDGRPVEFGEVFYSQLMNRVSDVDSSAKFGHVVGVKIEGGKFEIPHLTPGTYTVTVTSSDKDEAADDASKKETRTITVSAASPYALQVPDGMVKFAARKEIEKLATGGNYPPDVIEAAANAKVHQWRAPSRGHKGGYGYWLLIIAGVGIFCGCVGKSAQFPLHTWLPDAMEGPTPVSALVHSATMVAAGVYLVGRFYPVFAPEVLLVIASIGAITLFLAATIAITATDIKRVLAYSTISQLGYMMLALGLGGWVAGLMHLITHAFFKSLLFLCSGSVIHAVHTNDMTKMGGLRKKMPVTAYTMLVGCLAIAGAGVPFVIGLSGYYSKDAILEQAYSYMLRNGAIGTLFFATAAGGAAITAFYMFRLWFMTFAGTPRDHHKYDHAHESPKTMYMPLVVLSVFAVGVAWPFFPLSLNALLEQARPAGLISLNAHDEDGAGNKTGSPLDTTGKLIANTWPDEQTSHETYIKAPVTMLAFFTALGGIALAAAFYGLKYLDPEDAKRQFAPIYKLLWNKWYFDELYDFLFVQPVLAIGRIIASFDRTYIDGFIDGTARVTKRFSSVFEWVADQWVVDGLVNAFAGWLYSTALWLRGAQTGRLRQYVIFIVIAAIAIFILISFFWNPTLAH